MSERRERAESRERWADEVADEIDRLRAENRRLRQALKDLAGCDDEQVDLIAQTDGQDHAR